MTTLSKTPAKALGMQHAGAHHAQEKSPGPWRSQQELIDKFLQGPRSFNLPLAAPKRSIERHPPGATGLRSPSTMAASPLPKRAALTVPEVPQEAQDQDQDKGRGLPSTARSRPLTPRRAQRPVAPIRAFYQTGGPVQGAHGPMPSTPVSTTMTATATATPTQQPVPAVTLQIGAPPAAEIGRVGFMRKMMQIAQVPVALFDLIAAATATVCTLSYAHRVLTVAADNLHKAVREVMSWKPLPVAATATAASAPAPASEPDVQAQGPQMPELMATLKTARTKMDAANRQVGMDLARANFVTRAIGVGSAAIGLGVAVTMTVLTHGAVLVIPGLVIATMLLRQAVANARCAWHNRQATARGEAPLPLGSNALGNALFESYRKDKKDDFDPVQAKLQAAKVSASVSLASVAIACGTALGIQVATPLIAMGARLLGFLGQGIVAPGAELARTHIALAAQRRQGEQEAAAAKVALEENLKGLQNPLETTEPAGYSGAVAKVLAHWPKAGGNLDALPAVLESLKTNPSDAEQLPEALKETSADRVLAKNKVVTQRVSDGTAVTNLTLCTGTVGAALSGFIRALV